MPRKNVLLSAYPILLLCLLAMAPTGPAFAASEAEEALQALLDKGRTLREAGKPGKAAKVFAEADLLAEGKSADALLGLALSCYQNGNSKDTLDAARRLLESSDDAAVRPAAYHLTGMAILGLSRPSKAQLREAEEAFQQALGAGPNRVANALFGLAQAQAALGRGEEAFASIETFLESNPLGPTTDAARIFACDLRKEWPDLPIRQGEPLRVDFMQHSDVTRPEKIRKNSPQFPYGAPDGRIILETVVDRLGCVTIGEVIEGVSRDFDQVAMAAIARWVFRPAVRDGKPVDVFFNLTVSKTTR